MAVLVMNCPHCRAELMSFEAVGDYRVDDRNTNASRSFYLVKCRQCGMPTVIEAKDKRGGTLLSFTKELTMPDHAVIIDTWPKLEAPSAPAHLPETVQRAYLAGAKTFAMEGLEEASAGAFGRALEIATKTLGSDFPNLTLAARIDRLAREHRITPALAEWAHQIRLIRNDAMHDVESVSRDELIAIRGFTEMVLTYVFTLPGMMVARQAEVPPSI